jgi:hypothetical protein
MNLPDETWLAWQRDHADALAALQEAQRAYHRTVVGAAGLAGAGVSPQADSLKAVDAARVRLDAVRARKPE